MPRAFVFALVFGVLAVLVLAWLVNAALAPVRALPLPQAKQARFTEGWPGVRPEFIRQLVWRHPPAYVELDGWA
jgi:hypothetical protein